MELFVEIVGDLILGALSVLFGIVSYAVIFRPNLIERKR